MEIDFGALKLHAQRFAHAFEQDEPAGALPLHIKGAQYLAQHHNGVLVAGGTAFDLLTTPQASLQTVQRKKEDGRLRDLDLICNINVEKAALRADIEQAVPGLHVDTGLSQLYRLTPEGDSIVHHDIVVALPPQVFTPVYVQIDDCNIPVLHPRTLLATLKANRGRYDREKDRKRAATLEAVLQNYPPLQEDWFGAFQEFVDRKMSMPLTRAILQGDGAAGSPLRAITRGIKNHVPGGDRCITEIRKTLFEFDCKWHK